MSKAWDYLRLIGRCFGFNVEAQDAAPNVCHADNPATCWKHGNKRKMKFKFLIGGVNGIAEEKWITATSFRKAVDEARWYGCNQNRFRKKDVWIRPLIADGYKCKATSLIDGDEQLDSFRISHFDMWLQSPYHLNAQKDKADSDVRQKPIKGTFGEIVPPPPPRREAKNGEESKPKQMTFSFDASLKKKAARYLGMVRGNLAKDAESKGEGVVERGQQAYDNKCGDNKRTTARGVAEDETLEEHDKKYHPEGYNKGDTCKFRHEQEKKDRADRVSEKKSEGGDSGESGKSVDENGSGLEGLSEKDRATIDIFKRWLPDTKFRVIDRKDVADELKKVGDDKVMFSVERASFNRFSNYINQVTMADDHPPFAVISNRPPIVAKKCFEKDFGVKIADDCPFIMFARSIITHSRHEHGISPEGWKQAWKWADNPIAVYPPHAESEGKDSLRFILPITDKFEPTGVSSFPIAYITDPEKTRKYNGGKPYMTFMTGYGVKPWRELYENPIYIRNMQAMRQSLSTATFTRKCAEASPTKTSSCVLTEKDIPDQQLGIITNGDGACQSQRVNGWHDREKNEVVVAKDANVSETVAHEMGWHATLDWAKKHHSELYIKLMQYANEATPEVVKAVVAKYGKRINSSDLIEEVGAARFTREVMEEIGGPINEASEKWWKKMDEGTGAVRDTFVKEEAPKTLSNEEIDTIAKLPPDQVVGALIRAILKGRSLGGAAKDEAKGKVARYLNMVADDSGARVEAQDETIEEHDKKYHKDGYEKGDECKFREELEQKQGAEPKGVKCPQSERDEVIAKYKGTDEWMKAPNGQPTKLSEKQWVQVRTPSFVKCFGNWPREEEVTRVSGWLMTAEPVCCLTGEEFGPNGEKLTDKVPRWYEQECGGVAESPEFGEVKLDREGVKDDLGHKMNRVKACAFAAVPDVIEKGIAYNRANNWKERGWDSAVIAAPIRIGEDDYICEVVIKDDGDRRGFYLHRVDYIDKFKLSLAMDPNYKKEGDKPISQNIIAELADECKKNPCCHDVDENGEPKKTNICVEDKAAKARERYLEIVAEDAKPIGVNKDGTFCYTEWCEKQAYKFSDDASDVIGGGGAESAEERAKREYDEVVKRYEGTAAWMRAPNGKATNLTERQWVQVRTPSFKKWFGDWEKCILGSATEDECKVVVDGWRRNRTEFRNKETGRVAEIKSDWSKLFSSVAKGESASYEAHYAAVMALDRLFEDSVLMWKEDPRNGSNDISAYAKYGQPFWFEGEAYLAKMTVKEYAQHVGIKDGFYSIEAISVEKINAAGNSGNISVKGQVLDRDVSNRISKRLDRVNGVSKVVNENGEPKVVYHGTAEEFTEFDPGHRKGICASSWFAEEMAVAEDYTHYGNGEPRVIEAFLNVKNPYDLRDTEFDGGAQIDDERNDGGQASEKEIALAAEISGMTPKEVHDKFYLQALWTVTQSPEMAKYAQSKGYDGIYLDEYGDNTIGVFKPNQIKSATENAGTFSGKSSDVTDSAAGRYLRMCEGDFAARGEAQDGGVEEGSHSLTRCAPSANGVPEDVLGDNKRTTTRGVAEDETLEEHDKKYHPGGYKEGDECNKRAEMEKEDKTDAEVGEQGGARNEGAKNEGSKKECARKSVGVTPEEDAAYADAVKRGDKETALRMIREAAAKAMPNTKVVDKDGLPLVVYRSKNEEYNVFEYKKLKGDVAGTGFWFTDKTAALSYSNTGDVRAVFLNIENLKSISVGEQEWNEIVTGYKTTDEYGNEYVFPSKNEAKKWILENDHSVDEIDTIYSTTNDIARQAKHDGYNGCLIEAVVDGGHFGERNWQDQYVAFDPSQIKSADITYDDAGNLIPLSKRFNMESVDIRDEAKGKIEKYLSACEDEWVDSGDGNIVWKPRNKGAKRRPVDRLPKRKVHEIIAENVGLIKTIDNEMLPWVAKNVYKVINGKMHPDDLMDWLMDECDVSEGRAGVIACDQVRKAYEKCKVEDWKRRGVKYAMWKHREGEKDPREYHMKKWDGKSGVRNGKPNGLDGFVFDLEKPPVIDLKTGQRGMPSDLVGCRCYLKGVKA